MFSKMLKKEGINCKINAKNTPMPCTKYKDYKEETWMDIWVYI